MSCITLCYLRPFLTLSLKVMCVGMSDKCMSTFVPPLCMDLFWCTFLNTHVWSVNIHKHTHTHFWLRLVLQDFCDQLVDYTVFIVFVKNRTTVCNDYLLQLFLRAPLMLHLLVHIWSLVMAMVRPLGNLPQRLKSALIVSQKPCQWFSTINHLDSLKPLISPGHTISKSLTATQRGRVQ